MAGTAASPGQAARASVVCLSACCHLMGGFIARRPTDCPHQGAFSSPWTRGLRCAPRTAAVIGQKRRARPRRASQAQHYNTHGLPTQEAVWPSRLVMHRTAAAASPGACKGQAIPRGPEWRSTNEYSQPHKFRNGNPPELSGWGSTVQCGQAQVYIRGFLVVALPWPF